MAYIAPDNFLKIRGKVGNKIFKLINGKIFVCKAPEVNTVDVSPEGKLKNEKFAAVQKVTSSIKKIPPLHFIWKNFLRIKNVHGMMFKQIWSKFNGIDAAGISLLPTFMFNAVIRSYSYSDGKILLTFEPVGSSSCIWPPLDLQVNVYGVLYLIYEGLPVKQKFTCIPVSSVDMRTVTDLPLEFFIQLSPVESEAIGNSSSTELFFVLVCSDGKGSPTKNSNTMYLRIK